jgi:CO/xanthine dehydrogenase FAD-binding subunit
MKTLKKFTHIDAETVDEASSALRQANAWAIAGGTDLLGVMRFEILPDNLYPQILVNLKTVTTTLNYVEEQRGNLNKIVTVNMDSLFW